MTKAEDAMKTMPFSKAPASPRRDQGVRSVKIPVAPEDPGHSVNGTALTAKVSTNTRHKAIAQLVRSAEKPFDYLVPIGDRTFRLTGTVNAVTLQVTKLRLSGATDLPPACCEQTLDVESTGTPAAHND